MQAEADVKHNASRHGNPGELRHFVPTSLFALGIALRAALIGAIAFAVMQLLAHSMYASALVLAAVAVLLTISMVREATKADRLLSRFVNEFTAQDFQRRTHAGPAMRGFRRLAEALDRAGAAIGGARAAYHRELDHLQALLDNVGVAVLLVESDGSVVLANRSARKLAARPVRRLDDIVAIGETLATALLDIPPGRHAVVRLTTGQRVLASAAHFAAAERRARLISLQNIESELDAVEIKAWQDLVRILSHEMMNSLTPISSLAASARPLLEQLRGAADPARAVTTIDDVTAAVDTIARRSIGLMSFVERYRRMAELPHPKLRPLPLADIIARIDQLMASTLASRGVTLVCRIDPSDLRVLADPDLLEQALINLMHNAIDAVEKIPDPCVQVTCNIHDEHAAIRIADNGHGLDPALLERIFVPFFTTKPGGSGIGLSLARQIARAHHGRLEAAANAHQGAVFTMFVPLGKEQLVTAVVPGHGRAS